MGFAQDRLHDHCEASVREPVRRGLVWASVVVVLGLVAIIPPAAAAQQAERGASPLVFDGVSVVDVERGKLLPAQRVVITGNRI